jgi:diguanylate cyclase (GGDEF)-like protein/PAS domain S-box-containing protein
MYRNNFGTLRYIVFGLITLSTLAIGLTIWGLRSDAIEEADSNTRNIASMLSEQLSRSIQSVDIVLTDVREKLKTESQLTQNSFGQQIYSYDTYRFLKEQLGRLSQANFIAIIDKDGWAAATTQQWPTPKTDIADRDYFQHFKNENDTGIYISSLLTSRVTGGQTIFLSKRLNGANDEFLGVILIGLRLSYFESVYQLITPLQNDSFLLLHTDGTVLIRYPNAMERDNAKMPAASPWYNSVAAGGGHYLTRGYFDGQARFVSVQPLHQYPLVINVAISEAAALANWYRRATLIGLGTIVALICSAFLLKVLSNNLRRILESEAALVKREKSLAEKTHELQRANDQIDAALHNMSQGLCMFDGDGRLIICNDRYIRMYDLSREVVKPGCTLREMLEHRKQRGSFMNDPLEYETKIRDAARNREGRTVTIELSDGRIIKVVDQPLADGCWVATHEDITEKARAENLIKNQKEQLNATLENISQAVCMFDADQRLTFCNEHYVQLFKLNDELTKPGTRLRSILEHRIARGAMPNTNENVINDWINQIKENKPFQAVTRLRDGRYISFVHRPMVSGGWVATHEDVTERVLREESFRLLFEGNPVPMCVVDEVSLRFLAVNEAAVKHYGYSSEQILSMTAADLQPPLEREHFAQFVQGLPREQLVGNVTQHTKADGTTIDVSVHSRRMIYAGHNARLVAIHDITDRKRAEDNLRRTQKFLDTIVENVPVPIMVKEIPNSTLDARGGRITLINRSGEELYGIPRREMIGKTTDELYPKERADFIVAHDNETLQSDQPVLIHDHSLVTPGNGTRLVTTKKVAIRDDGGKPQLLLTVFEDVTERRRGEQRIVHMAHYDALTDLPNRATFNETLESALNRARTVGKRFAVLSVDLDRFKEANDTYGHLVGDKLLCEVASRLKMATEGAFIARLGGDEFILIAADDEQPAAATKLADRLLATFVDDFEVDGHRLKLGTSIGIAIYPTGGTDAKTLMINADAALYRAKAEFRGTARFFEPEMSARLHERYALQEDLRVAIDHGELLLHYQPQMKMSGEAVGFEALVRWQSPKRGLVEPGTFIPIAEESSLIIALGEWVLREACREAASWPQPLTIAVNISPIQFRHGDLPNLVHSILLETGLAPRRLELEITESVMMNDFSRAVSVLNRLKSLGVRIAMDDFGTGYSSLSYLRSFTCDKIKIDRVFVSDLEQNHHSRSIVRAVIGLGRSLDLPILAEGVETEAQHAFLVQEGCDEVQGYLTGRPLPITEYAKLVGRQMIAEQNRAIA